MSIIPGPSILPQYAGGNMGQSIADAYMTKYQLDRQKALDAIQYGIGLQWPGANGGNAQPTSADAPIGFGDKLRAALSHVGIGSNPVPAKQAEWKLAQGGPSVSVTPNANTPGGLVAGGMQGSRGWDEQPDGASLGGLPDYMQLPNGQRIPTIMTPFGSKILQALKIRSDIALAGTEADKNTAEAGLSRRKASVPMPQDANYVTTMQPIWGGEAGAKAAAAYPYQAGLAGIRNQGTLGAAQIGASSRIRAAGITAGASLQRTGMEQAGEDRRIAPKAQAGAQAAQSTEGYKEGGEIIPSIVRPINNGLRSLIGAQPLGTPSATPSTGALPSARTTITSAERAALIHQGFAPADIDAKYQVQGAPGGGSSF